MMNNTNITPPPDLINTIFPLTAENRRLIDEDPNGFDINREHNIAIFTGGPRETGIKKKRLECGVSG